MRKFMIALLVIAALTGYTAFSRTAWAQARISCPSCSEQGYANAAVSYGVGDHHVFDLPRGQLRRYFVECMSNSQQMQPSMALEQGSTDATSTPTADESSTPAITMYGCDGMLYPNEEVPDPATAEAFGYVKQFYDETGGSFSKEIEVPISAISVSNPPGSAYDVAWNSNQRGMIADSLTRNIPNASAAANWLLGHGASAFGFTDGVVITVTITFTDGSQVQYQCELGKSAKYVEGSARTPGGQVIPDSSSANYAGEWLEISGGITEDLEQFVFHLQRLGIPIERAEGARIRRVTCSWDGRTLRCTTT